MHHGSPATQGSGGTRYSVRIVFEISSFDQLKGLFGDTFNLGGFPATIRHHSSFYVLRVTEFPKAETAERFARVIRVAMMELSARKGLTMWMHPLSNVERNESPMNTPVRDAFAEQSHPEWKRGADGTVTDGAIWPNQSCVLAEHERIWEYPVLWAKPVRELTAEDFQAALRGRMREKTLILPSVTNI